MSLQRIQNSFDWYNPTSVKAIEVRDINGAYIQMDPHLPFEKVLAAFREDLHLDPLDHPKIDRGASTTFCIIKDYFVFHEVPNAIQLTVRRASHILVTTIYMTKKDRVKAVALHGAPALLIHAITPQPTSQTACTIHIDVDLREHSIVYATTNRFQMADCFDEKFGENINEFIPS